ncbi:hypothetical protein QOZ88_03885 [Blastococcus sp. BMG 814]|uniref:Uncharacterized protein n=1 Tax=Blastococcus carthaginiensis TaxID=3050034 RepID=A0ABT9I964_9ACTN|nr:hypothetical protein [Blastococcus carthaginiensis]MDP5181767.1 hypothetical protein [Blastococcus carthaginiensis]
MGDDQGTGAVPHLGETMSRVARRLQEEHGDVEAITTAAVGAVPGAHECGITYVIGRTRVEPRAATSDLPREVDRLQDRVGEGPCLDAVFEEETVRVDDVAGDRRWPEFAPGLLRWARAA